MLKRSSLQITKAVLFALVLREVRGRIGRNRLGAFWFVFEPIAHILVLMAIFTFLRGRSVQGMDFPVFLVTGIVPFLLFKNIALKGMEAINANKALFAYRQIKPIDTVFARVIVELSLTSLIYIVLMGGLGLWGGYDVATHAPLEWLLALAIGIMLSVGLALILCVIGQALPEMKTAISLCFMPLYLMSGVILPVWLTPKNLLDWMMWNPYLHIIDSLRNAVFEHYPTTAGISLLYAAKVSLVILYIGTALYRARRYRLIAL
ncbi:ABC transporter permease [Alcaligenaceae bacterium A4P071]|nr:ABC transporter permease [Alcaligenaceae bacterium A4P071]